MTIQQLEYILAVDQFRHFARAAEYCRVTQPTLSAMIQKLEDELGVKLFDRTVQPVCPTPIGQKVIDQARVILAQAAQVKEIISEDKQSLSGVFRLGVLPTIAPYLLPRFFPQLMEKYPELDLVVLIGSVRNTHRIESVFEQYHPDIVYHAAAHKHVPLMEDSSNEAIKNNVFGTYKTARAADKYGAKRFVLISTDKAVNPTNIMGASKRMCEMVIQMMNARSKTDFVAVRFGNVLGSNGSVIPLFKRQIEQGGPVTVTHPDIIRYFMTIPEAVSLVLQAGAYAKGGEIFVLDMGEPVKILDLAKNLIQLSGYTSDVDIPIVFTGLRPGEKLYEELLMSEEGMQDTPNKLIHIGKPIDFDMEAFEGQLQHLYEVAYQDGDQIRTEVQNIVKTYHPANI